MKISTLLGVALIWGQLSTQFFFRSWLSFLGVICCIIGLFKSKVPARYILSVLFTKVSETVFFGLILFTGFYVFYYRLEFGKSELLSTTELVQLGYDIVIYPVTALRLANKAIEDGLRHLRDNGSQAAMVEQMQTRSQLYELLRYDP